MRFAYDSNARTHVTVCDSVIEAADSFLEFNGGERESDDYDWVDVKKVRYWADGFVGRRFDTAEEVVDACTAPWERGMRLIEEMAKEMATDKFPKIRTVKRQVRFNPDDGDEVCVDRALAGSDYWRRSQREQTTGVNRLTIVIDMATSCVVNARDVMWRGLAALLLTQMLERAGHRVEIWLASQCGESYRKPGEFPSTCFLALRAKRFRDPFNIQAIVGGVSGWFYRTVIFSLYNPAAREHGLQVHGCLGSVERLNRDLFRYFTPEKPEQIVVADHIWNRRVAVNWVTKAIERANKHHTPATMA